MIGVAVHPREREIVTEFFELFKTPWEFLRADEEYDVVLSTVETFRSRKSALVLVLGAEVPAFDRQQKIRAESRSGGVLVSDEGKRLPIYNALAIFPGSSPSLLKEESTQQAAAVVIQLQGATILRLGYNPFAEARFLLTTGQPAANSAIPTLEEHIGWLRDWITLAGLPSVEIPAVPAGYNFISCLTHDIDNPALRNHRCDHTMLGFLYRSTIGTLFNVCRGRKSFKSLWRNWQAACRLPFVHLGMANDYWAGFDRYLEIEDGCGATFFVIPHKGYAGRTMSGPAPAKRACRYNINEVFPKLQRIISAGQEVGVHGLDAWLSVDDGRRERARVSRWTGTTDLGVRMHWLFFNEDSLAVLDRAGFSYDTTVGYRETVGYRAGTTQAYRPLGVANLLELPLHVMDTALFYPAYLDLSEAEAERRVNALLDDVRRIGGALTINWHDRSIAPERLWDEFYVRLLGQLRDRGAWLPNAALAVAWFRKRRAAALKWSWSGIDTIKVQCRLETDDKLPGLKVRIFQPRARSLSQPVSARRAPHFLERQFDETTDFDFGI